MNYSAGKSKSAVGPESMENFNGPCDSAMCAWTFRTVKGPLGIRENGVRDHLESSIAAKRVYLTGILKLV